MSKLSGVSRCDRSSCCPRDSPERSSLSPAAADARTESSTVPVTVSSCQCGQPPPPGAPSGSAGSEPRSGPRGLCPSQSESTARLCQTLPLQHQTRDIHESLRFGPEIEGQRLVKLGRPSAGGGPSRRGLVFEGANHGI